MWRDECTSRRESQAGEVRWDGNLVMAPDLTIDHVLQARARINPYIHNTPILTSTYLNEQIGAELFLNVRIFRRPGPLRYEAPVTLSLA